MRGALGSAQTRQGLSPCTRTGKRHCIMKKEVAGFAALWFHIDVLARICTVLECEISDLLTFVPPEQDKSV